MFIFVSHWFFRLRSR